MKAVCRRLLVVLAVWASLDFLPTPAIAAGNYELGIAPSGRTVLLSWPAAATNYVLQSSLNLAAADWLTLANPVIVSGATNFVTYTNDSSARFFRLYLASGGFYLSIVRSNGTYIIFWPSAASNYVLQSSVSLDPANWSTVTRPPTVTVNTTNFVFYTNNSASSGFFRLWLNTNSVNPYAGMVLIPAGAFTMGNSSADSDITDAGTVSATLSSYYMDTNLVTYSLWQTIYNAAIGAGYSFVDAGAGQGPDHPVQSVNWYDAVKWCNARSQQAGLVPAYYTDAGLTQIYTNGQTDAVYVNWAATGYRLPTEAEWEKAARGRLTGQRFPWGNSIAESQANYYGNTTYSYDLGPNGNNYLFESSGQPYTSPAGFFGPNGYGLFDMAGNVMQWCWDWYGTPYTGGTDPHGPASGPNRVSRGGDWQDDASYARCADRSAYSQGFPYSTGPGQALNLFGFRCVRGH
jgi:formylglycine-generating enzyme required for sulfatase activity